MQRIAVIGCGGAGKTKLARELSELVSLPVLHIDEHYWRHVDGQQVESTPDQWAQTHRELVAGLHVRRAGRPASLRRSKRSDRLPRLSAPRLPGGRPRVRAGTRVRCARADVSLERGKLWQAEFWVSVVRDHTLTLACLRLGHPADYAKGADDLPREISATLEAALVPDLSVGELGRALRVAVTGLLRELYETDRELADRLRDPLRELAAFQ